MGHFCLLRTEDNGLKMRELSQAALQWEVGPQQSRQGARGTSEGSRPLAQIQGKKSRGFGSSDQVQDTLEKEQISTGSPWAPRPFSNFVEYLGIKGPKRLQCRCGVAVPGGGGPAAPREPGRVVFPSGGESSLLCRPPWDTMTFGHVFMCPFLHKIH